ncbi:hypothetical protein Ahy_B05g077696 [Arachis hypogaea]|uniref:Uncharacterized protein n=1 Tax=Arachis hypogaea TaxID=3818 RepID=A0A444Z5F5_ARAHY|nr:hypothetical protein Ahy_B05g077696 [Arachis hypogaea]
MISYGNWQLDEAFSGDYYNFTSPDSGALSAVSKDIVFDKNSMKQINERLFALRIVIPNITKVYRFNPEYLMTKKIYQK